MTIRNYHFSFSFRVGGRKSGYDCVIEVKAATKKGAAQKVRNRIRKMPDVATMPQFHYDDLVRGLAVLTSEGHISTRKAKFTRPSVLAKDGNSTLVPERETREPEAYRVRRSAYCSSF